ncbi:hypothetical protein BTE48_15870 [Oceanospirillum multiglobuliferum]|uniref:Acyltransferase 3 domain-containing protein n=2 Tax=Oceanospirillum multiglobuliferum TaxID=64969 RepID=A0A1V4T0K5_9GAMM|nr:hypothetical protein BTE48_15870 [Oceanospirillum multiglobuliferum]
MVLVHHYVFYLTPVWAERLLGLHFFHVGVDLFFVLTGYLFAPLLLGFHTQTIKVFVRRRIWRLYPMYLISLILALFLSAGDLGEDLFQLLRHLLFLQAAPDQNLADVGYFSEVYWTLTVEVAFYVLIALSLKLPHSWLSSSQRFWWLAVIAMVGFITLYSFQYAPSNKDWVVRQAQLPALLIEFWFGMAVFWLLKQSGDHYKHYYPLFLGFGLVILVALYWYYPTALAESISPRPFGWFNVLAAFGFALLLAGILLAQQKGLLLPKSWGQMAVKAGAGSYGIYLLHDFIAQLVFLWAMPPNISVVTALLLTLCTSVLLYKWVEAPCREYGRSK